MRISHNTVSIHLMLLFITVCLAVKGPTSGFQYISCYSLSIYGRHLHTQKNRFNTSHVTLYPGAPGHCTGKVQVSIHLMLLFIVIKIAKNEIGYLFQYISCYSLSLNFSNLTVAYIGFNTSHVTLYQGERYADKE